MKKYFLVFAMLIVASSVQAQSVVFKKSAIQESIMGEEPMLLPEITVEPTKPEPEPVVVHEPVAPARPEPVKLYSGNYKIVALVNGDIISSRDLQSGVNMFIINSGIPYNSKTKEMIMHRVMQGLIDDKLKITEAKKNGIIVDQKEINKALRAFAESNKIEMANLEKTLNSDGIHLNSLKTQIEADSAWQKLVSKRLSAQSQITPLEIKKEKANIVKGMEKSRYMISEIVISAKNAKDINGLVATLREDPRFELYAMQFSESASASRGGNLGWVNKENLLPQILKEVEKMKEGAVSSPIRVGDKYYVIKLAAKYNPTKDKPKEPSDDEVRRYLQNKKTDEIVNRYTQEIRNRAIIEIRN